MNLLRLKRWREAKEDFKKKGKTKLLGPEPCLLEGWETEREREDVSEGSSIEHYPNALLLLLNSEVVNNHVQSPVKLTNVTHPFINQGRAYLTQAFAIDCTVPSSN